MDRESLARIGQPDHPGTPPPQTRTCAACGGLGEYVSEAVFDYASGVLTQEIAQCVSCGGAGTLGNEQPYTRTLAEVKAHRERVEDAQAKAAAASTAVWLLADDLRVPPERMQRAAGKLDEAVAELRSLGVIA